MSNKLRSLVLSALMTPILLGEGSVDITRTPAIQQYCHTVQFSQGWNIENYDPIIHQPVEYEYGGQYEFRVSGVLETTFLIAGIALPSKHYTISKYKVDFADPKGMAVAATEQEWQSGAKIRDAREDDIRKFGNIGLAGDQALSFHGAQFRKSGNLWRGDYARLSPDQGWIVLLSSSGEVAKGRDFIRNQGRDEGQAYYDMFNAETGEKVLTIIGTYLDIFPSEALNQSAWVTERYFVVPMGEHRERALVCDLRRVGRKGKP